jgi:haloalkane dehalogenase
MLVKVEDADIYYVDRGSGELILFLHGTPDSADMWLPMIANLEGEYRCIAPDLPGMGRSGVPDQYDFSLSAMANFIEAFVSALNLPLPLNLVMHDFGGPYGMSWATRNGTSVRRLLCMDFFFFPDFKWHKIAQLWRTPVVGELVMALLTYQIFRKQMLAASKNLSEDQIRMTWDLSFANRSVRSAVLRLTRATDPQNFAGWEEAMLLLTPTIPTRVVWARDDILVPSRYATRFGTTDVHLIIESGHWVPVEALERVTELLRELVVMPSPRLK